ncbi:MAG: GNAT family N-acetyltransferase [Planctomycetota bacterium]|jgi:GNAT superfamily N-acetyltransferase
MGYNVISFRNNQFEEYKDFLKNFELGGQVVENAIGENWWSPSRKLAGFIFFAFTKKEIAAHCVITEKRQWYHDHTVPCFEIGATFTYPEHRRRGLFSRLVNEATRVGFEAGAKLIYGTPNDRSGPGYRKLGYRFVDTPNTYLVLIPNPANLLMRKLQLKTSPTESVRQGQSVKHFYSSLNLREISLYDYTKLTERFPRMNSFENDYLYQRLRHNHRFFSGSGRGQFYCVTRKYLLGSLQLMLVSEYFLDGHVDTSYHKFPYLRCIEHSFYRNVDGIYLKSYVPPASQKFLLMLRQRFLLHRTLPICYKYAGPDQDKADKMMAQLAKVFQLTDCDIG